MRLLGPWGAMPRDHRNPGDMYPNEPRAIDGAQGSPPERRHHDPRERSSPSPPIAPAARDPASTHKQPVRHAHDAHWRKLKRR